MSAKFHMNPTTHAISRCHAENGKCPFGGDTGTENHFDTLEEARSNYEKMMKNKEIPKPAIKKKKETPKENHDIKVSEDPNLTDEYARKIYINNSGWDKKAIARNILLSPSDKIKPETRVQMIKDDNVTLTQQTINHENFRGAELVPKLNLYNRWEIAIETKDPATLEALTKVSLNGDKRIKEDNTLPFKEQKISYQDKEWNDKIITSLIKNDNLSDKDRLKLAKTSPKRYSILKFSKLEKSNPKIFENLIASTKDTRQFSESSKLTYIFDKDKAKELNLTGDELKTYLVDYCGVQLFDTKWDEETGIFTGYKN